MTITNEYTANLFEVHDSSIYDTQAKRWAIFPDARSAQIAAVLLSTGAATSDEYAWNAQEDVEAAFIEQHPEISAVIPTWIDEVELDLDGLDINGTATFHGEREFCHFDIALSGTWKDGNAQLHEDEGPYGLYFESTDNMTFTADELAAYARRVAADLLNAARLIGGAA